MVANFKSGKLRRLTEYESFSPSFINGHPFQISDNPTIASLNKAERLLGELNAYAGFVPNIDIFIQMHISKEATESSKIEGTKTELDDALLSKNQIADKKRDDWIEVKNYTKAMNYAIEKLNELPMSMRLLKETHKILLSQSRGEKKLPGEIRKSQNWIGGQSLKDASFIPPRSDEVPDLLSDLEKFLNNNEDNIPVLMKAAIAHYQFETIHPFLDGNGRVGRLLIILYLMEQKVLSHPVLYLSEFFSRNRIRYYDALTEVRIKNGLKSWILFFIQGVVETADRSIKVLKEIMVLREDINSKILPLGNVVASRADKLIQYMYRKPIIDIKEIQHHLNITYPTANSLVKNLEELKIIYKMNDFKRNRLFKFTPYIELFK